MAAQSNVELEAATFLHKLIQESKDEPTKLARKLYVILQHMRSSGKENSMPYQVISRLEERIQLLEEAHDTTRKQYQGFRRLRVLSYRDMETVISQHAIDIEALKSSRFPLPGANHVGDSSSTQFSGSSQTAAAVKDVFSATPSGEYSAGKGAVDTEYWNQGIRKGPVTSTCERTEEARGFSANLRELSLSNASTAKSLVHDDVTENKNFKGSIPGNSTETNMVRGVTARDTEKSPMSQDTVVSSLPFKEQHLKQLRAQCLVFLAFRNGVSPKKLHLEIALGRELGSAVPKEDGTLNELTDHKGKDLPVNDKSKIPGNTMLFGGLYNQGEPEVVPQGNSTGTLAQPNLLKVSDQKTKGTPQLSSDMYMPTEERKHILDVE